MNAQYMRCQIQATRNKLMICSLSVRSLGIALIQLFLKCSPQKAVCSTIANDLAESHR